LLSEIEDLKDPAQRRDCNCHAPPSTAKSIFEATNQICQKLAMPAPLGAFHFANPMQVFGNNKSTAKTQKKEQTDDNRLLRGELIAMKQ